MKKYRFDIPYERLPHRHDGRVDYRSAYPRLANESIEDWRLRLGAASSFYRLHVSATARARQSTQHRQYYGRNRVSRKAMIVARQKRILDIIRSYKLEKGCCFCGYKRSARALHFHHADEATKRHDVSRMVAQGRSINGIFTEIDKCNCVCSNCHFEIHDDEMLETTRAAFHVSDAGSNPAGSTTIARGSNEHA